MWVLYNCDISQLLPDRRSEKLLRCLIKLGRFCTIVIDRLQLPDRQLTVSVLCKSVFAYLMTRRAIVNSQQPPLVVSEVNGPNNGHYNL